jgi:hypothetical protein
MLPPVQGTVLQKWVSGQVFVQVPVVYSWVSIFWNKLDILNGEVGETHTRTVRVGDLWGESRFFTFHELEV